MTTPVVGLMVPAEDEAVAQEFFELFKTPCEPVRQGRRYGAVIATTGMPEAIDATLLIAYGAREQAIDRVVGARVCAKPGRGEIRIDERAVPLYHASCTFTVPPAAEPEYAGSGYRIVADRLRCHRVGYDLFAEVRHLLDEGQPTELAAVPTLDLHVAHLRQILRHYQVPFLEVLPRPSSAPFICCLTHDVDFYGMRRHGLDRSVAGFALRASVGSLRDAVAGRRTIAECARNVFAALTMPFVLLGLAPDRWRVYADYARVDGTRASTFFVIPKRGHAGVSPSGQQHPDRSVKHEAADARADLATAVATGREVALHGLDAWRECGAARDERQRVVAVVDRPVRGVRMHWLYRDPSTNKVLDAAGFDYDSTCGYNDGVGFRAGTTQGFRPLGCRNLLELPLHVMDSALFFPDRLGLTQDEGVTRCQPILAHASVAGGVVVINWHDRSLEPERQWNRAYASLLERLDNAGPWYATAGAAADWFRWRRGVRFEYESDGAVNVVPPPQPVGVPGGLLRIHRVDGGVEDLVVADAPLMAFAS